MKSSIQAVYIFLLVLVSAVLAVFLFNAQKDRDRFLIVSERRQAENLKSQLDEAKRRLEASEHTIRELNGSLEHEKRRAVRSAGLYAANKILSRKHAALVEESSREIRDLSQRLGKIMGQNERLRQKLEAVDEQLTSGNPAEQPVPAGSGGDQERMKGVPDELTEIGSKMELLLGSGTSRAGPAIQLTPEAQQTVKELDAQISNLEGLLTGIEASQVKKLNDLRQERLRAEELKKQCRDSAAEIKVYAQEVADLRRKLDDHRERISSRDERIVALESKLREAEQSVVQAQARTREMEQESAVLREKCVEAQLERESLIVELNLARIKLAEFQQRLNVAGRPQHPVTRADGAGMYEPARNVNVEILDRQ